MGSFGRFYGEQIDCGKICPFLWEQINCGKLALFMVRFKYYIFCRTDIYVLFCFYYLIEICLFLMAVEKTVPASFN